MKINLIGMILANCKNRVFNGCIIDDNGKPMSDVDSLNYMILEHAKVVNGGTSSVVAVTPGLAREIES